MALNLTNADKALKEFYLPAVRNQFNFACPTLQWIEQKKVPVEGRRAVLSLRTGRNNTVVARREGATFPTSIGNTGYSEERVSMRYLYAFINVTGQAIKAMKSDKGSFVRAVRSEMENATEEMKRDVNRQVWGTSDGALIATGTSNNTTIINLNANATETQLRQLFVGQRTDAGTVAEQDSLSGQNWTDNAITAIDFDNFTVTMTTAGTTTPSDFLFQFGNGGTTTQKELTGLQTIVDSTGSLFNVDPATVPEWRAQELGNSGTPRALSESLMADGVHRAYIASGEWPDIGVCSEGVWRAYATLLTSAKRYTGTTDLKGGYKALSFSAGGGEVPIIFDRDVPGHRGSTVGGQLFFLNRKHLSFGYESDWDWMDEDGSVLHWTGTSDSYTAVLFRYCELFTDKRNAHAKVTDILAA